MKKLFLILAVALTTVVAGMTLCVVGYELYLRYSNCATEFTPQFSREHFNKIKKGTPGSEVIAAIGQPFGKWSQPGGLESWVYSRGNGKWHYEVVGVCISTQDGKVVRTFSVFDD